MSFTAKALERLYIDIYKIHIRVRMKYLIRNLGIKNYAIYYYFTDV